MPLSNFSKRAQFYEGYAHTQEQSAKELLSESLDILPGNSRLKIADLGCGTGIICQNAVKEINDLTFHNFDISEQMLTEAKKRIDSDKTKYFKGSIPSESDYDLVISNFALQWYDNPDKAILDSLKCLKPGGILSICLPVAGSFASLEKVFKSQGEENAFFNFPDTEKITSSIEGEIINKSLYFREEEHESTLSFLKSIHNMGANQAGKRVAPGKLRKIIQTHDELFDGKIIVRYKILKLIVKRVP